MLSDKPRRPVVFLITVAIAAVVAIAAWIVIGAGAAILALATVPLGALVAIEAQLGLITAGLVVMLVTEARGQGGGPARPDVTPDQAAGE